MMFNTYCSKILSISQGRACHEPRCPVEKVLRVIPRELQEYSNPNGGDDDTLLRSTPPSLTKRVNQWKYGRESDVFQEILNSSLKCRRIPTT